MGRIDIHRTLDAPIESVFEILTDHPGYTRFSSITEAEMGREGAREPNGLGAVRKLRAGEVWFHEEITVFERPTRFDYLILRSNLPIEHDGGSIRFTPDGDRTHVRWLSTYSSTIPVIGTVVNAALKVALERSFHEMLTETERFARSPAFV